MAQGPLIGKSRDPQPGEEYFDETEQAWATGLRKLGAKVGTRDLIVRPDEMSWFALRRRACFTVQAAAGKLCNQLAS